MQNYMNMSKDSPVFKIAEEAWEFEEIYRLNYKTFVEEIPQHQHNKEKKLQDKFDSENTYIICVSDKKILGILVLNQNRPFSLDLNFPDLDQYIPKADSICEIRLLAIQKEYSNGFIDRDLIIYAHEYCTKKGVDLLIISRNINKLVLYKALGFKSFGSVVGKDDTKLQPMFLIIKKQKNKMSPKSKPNITDNTMINFLPGPVNIADSVYTALSRQPVSHRSESFMDTFESIREKLRKLLNVKYVEIATGSGTLANDIVAAQLAQIQGEGILISNGEFSERLIENAEGAGLNFDQFAIKWGQKFDLKQIEDKFIANSNIKWLWMTHCETSTGMLNDIDRISLLCEKYNIKLAVDCISTVGTNILDLSKCYLVSISSGKGLASFSGLAIVGYNHIIKPNIKPIPRFFDLHYYSQTQGVPFSLPTNLIFALEQALINLDITRKVEIIAHLSQLVYVEIEKLNLKLLIPKTISNHAVITVVLSNEINSNEVGAELEKDDILISYKSSYLLKRNWIQFCIMSDLNEKAITLLFEQLKTILIKNKQN